MITVIGMHDPAFLPPAVRERVATCDLLVGGRRHLQHFPGAGRERLVIGAAVKTVLERIRAAHVRGAEVVVLASGDPLWYGIGATLRRVFSPEALHIITAPSAAQLAFAALAEPWHDALLLSAHGRPLEPIIVRMLAERRRAAILTDNHHTPGVIAARLLAAGFPDCPAAVCERLGDPTQRVVRASLSTMVEQHFDPLNVLVVLAPESISSVAEGSNSHARGAITPVASAAAPMGHPEPSLLPSGPADRPFGLFDEELEHDGLITHLEVRAVALAALRLRPADIVWDIGAGSGAVALEAARIASRGQVFAVERAPERVTRMRRNLERWGGGQITLCEGEAPAACAGWPDPDAVFIGGSGGRIEELIRTCATRLRSGGRLVINLVTLELLGQTIELFRRAGLQPTVGQIAVSRSRPLLGQTYLAALNPVYIVSAVRDTEAT